MQPTNNFQRDSFKISPSPRGLSGQQSRRRKKKNNNERPPRSARARCDRQPASARGDRAHRAGPNGSPRIIHARPRLHGRQGSCPVCPSATHDPRAGTPRGRACRRLVACTPGGHGASSRDIDEARQSALDQCELERTQRPRTRARARRDAPPHVTRTIVSGSRCLCPLQMRILRPSLPCVSHARACTSACASDDSLASRLAVVPATSILSVLPLPRASTRARVGA